MEVKIYTTPTCGYCRQAKRFLTEMDVRFTEYDVSRDRAVAEEMVNLTGQMGVPVIVVDGQAVIGFDRARLEALLADRDSGQRPHFGLKIADAGKAAEFSKLKEGLVIAHKAINYPSLSAELDMTEGAVRVAVHRMRKRFRELYRAEVAQTLPPGADLDNEVRQLAESLIRE